VETLYHQAYFISQLKQFHQHLEFHCLVSQAAADEFLASPDLWHPIKSGLHGARWGVRFLRGQYELLTELARDANWLIVTNPGILAARLVQDRHAKPVATLLLQPGLLPSVCAPPVMPAVPLPQWAPRWAGHIYWRMVDAVGDLLVGRELNRVRDSASTRMTLRYASRGKSVRDGGPLRGRRTGGA
jgi:rhamnosyltransferase subunit B